LHLLRKGKSVAYATDAPNAPIMEFAIRNKILVVPVFVSGENARYNVLHFPYPWIQQWFHGKIGWSFPYWFFPRIFSKKPLERLDVQVGTPMDASIHENVEKFSLLFMGQFCGVV